MNRSAEWVREDLIESFGLPSWLERNCETCGVDLFLGNLTDVGIDFSKKNFGNIIFGMHCGYCGSLSEHIAISACTNFDKVLEAFGLDKMKVISRQESLTSLENNIDNYMGENMMIKRSTTTGFVQKLSATELVVDEAPICCCVNCDCEYDDPAGPFCPKCGSHLENYDEIIGDDEERDQDDTVEN